MLIDILIITLSLGMLVYWFFYTCRLILVVKSSRLDETPSIAVKESTDADPQPALEAIHRSLKEDYAAVIGILRRGYSASGAEIRILMIDFRLMNIWYAMTRQISATSGRKAILEMTLIVRYLDTVCEFPAEASVPGDWAEKVELTA